VDPETFKREAEQLTQLDHPSLLKTLGFVPQTAEQQAAVLTELADRGTLAGLLAKPERLNSTQRAKILVGVVQALKYLHEKKLVHGQLKPNNIAVDAEGNPQLIGHTQIFARGRRADTTATAWAAPESLSDGTVTAASDIYSLSLLGFQLITDQPVFDPSLKTWPLMQAIMTGPKPDLSGLHPAVAGLIDRGWDADPSRRPTAGEFFEILSSAEFQIRPDVDVRAVRKYAGRFVAGAQPGESASEAELRANEQTREDVGQLKQTVGVLTAELVAVRAANVQLARSFEVAVTGLADRVEALALRVADLSRAKEE
jgi:serine/threonine protein kinase